MVFFIKPVRADMGIGPPPSETGLKHFRTTQNGTPGWTIYFINIVEVGGFGWWETFLLLIISGTTTSDGKFMYRWERRGQTKRWSLVVASVRPSGGVLVGLAALVTTIHRHPENFGVNFNGQTVRAFLRQPPILKLFTTK